MRRNKQRKRVRNKRRQRQLRVEQLEDRRMLASAADIENKLLPLFMAQSSSADEDDLLPASDAWWALRSQRNMAFDEPESNVMHLGAHNAYNALNEGFNNEPFVAPNQILSITAQLNLGARLLDLDIHDPTSPSQLFNGDLIMRHSGGGIQRIDVDSVFAGIRTWLDAEENRNEVILLFIEDQTAQPESQAPDKLIPKLTNAFGSLIYTPAERAADGAWPSRRDLANRNKRIIIFHDRNKDKDKPHSPDNDGRFGEPVMQSDPDGHDWYFVAPRGAPNQLASSIAFRANGDSNPSPFLGNHRQKVVNELADSNFVGVPSEDINSYFSMTSDGLDLTPIPGAGFIGSKTRRATEDDVREAVKANVNIVKMDFLLGEDEDAGLGCNLCPPGLNDDFFELPENTRIARLEAAVWSWKPDEPAVDRQMFQDLIPGDGTGAGLEVLFLEQLRSAFGSAALAESTVTSLKQLGADARENGRDYAVQSFGGRWESVTNSGDLPFAARSRSPGPGGAFDWRVTTRTGTWDQGEQLVREEFSTDRFGYNDDLQNATVLGSAPFVTLPELDIALDFVFAGPVNGFQNSQLGAARVEQFFLPVPIWINVDDADRDGNWTVNEPEIGGDIDFYKYTAHHTGKLIVNTLFQHDDGNLELEILDVQGNVIGSATSTDDNEQLIIPAVSQEMYFIKVFGEDDAENEYALEIENFAAPVPSIVKLDASDDSGNSNQDGVTAVTQPRFTIQADLRDFANMGIPILSATEANANDAPGAAIQVHVVNNDTGEVIHTAFADPLGASNTLFDLTLGQDLTEGTYLVSASVVILDGQQEFNEQEQLVPAPAQGSTQLSEPFMLMIADTAGPQVSSVTITDFSQYDLFTPKPDRDGPTPAINSLTIEVQDLVERGTLFTTVALDEQQARLLTRIFHRPSTLARWAARGWVEGC